jgi:hypothetical protein
VSAGEPFCRTPGDIGLSMQMVAAKSLRIIAGLAEANKRSIRCGRNSGGATASRGCEVREISILVCLVVIAFQVGAMDGCRSFIAIKQNADGCGAVSAAGERD